jgi:hypothetical protein
MRGDLPNGFDLQHAMSPPTNKNNKSKIKRDLSSQQQVGAGLSSPLFPDLSENDNFFDSEAQSHFTKNKEALANR